jgi:DUF971 family protein
VRGHGPDNKVLQRGKQGFSVSGIEPNGSYAIKIILMTAVTAAC